MTSMNSMRCPRCRDEFYSAVEKQSANCPYCGFSFNVSKQCLRKEARFDIRKECDISKGDTTVVAHTIDISRCGVGVQVGESWPFEKGDAIHVVVKNHEMNADGRVIWVKKRGNTVLRAGLKFC